MTSFNIYLLSFNGKITLERLIPTFCSVYNQPSN